MLLSISACANEAENLNLNLSSQFFLVLIILHPHALSIELAMRCGPAFKSQDWRACVSLLCLLQVFSMTLCKAFSFFPSKHKVVQIGLPKWYCEA